MFKNSKTQISDNQIIEEKRVVDESPCIYSASFDQLQTFETSFDKSIKIFYNIYRRHRACYNI